MGVVLQDQGRQVICISVVPCLSSGLAKNDVRVCHIFLAFLATLKLWLFSKMGGQTLRQSSQKGCFSQFFKGTTIR